MDCSHQCSLLSTQRIILQPVWKVQWASVVMGIWNATDKSRKFLEIWLYIYYSIILHWSPNYGQAPFVLDKHRKSKNSLCFRPVTKLLQLPVTSLQKFRRGVELCQNCPTQLTLIWGLYGGLSMSSIDGAWANPFYHSRYYQKLHLSVSQSWTNLLLPLSGCKFISHPLIVPSLGFDAEHLTCLRQYFFGTCKELVLHHETQEFCYFRGISLWQSVSLCTPGTDAPNLSCNSPALETAWQIQRFLVGIKSFRAFTEGKGTEEAA